MHVNAVRTWVDEQTGREVRQLTALPEGASVPYFRMPKHLPDGWMLVHARHEHGHLAALHPDTAELRPIHIGPPLGYLKHRPADGQAWFISGREVWTALLPNGNAERLARVPDDAPGSIADITCDGRTVILVEIVEEEKLALPIAQDAEYFWRFFARKRHGRIWAWDVASGALTKLVETIDVGFQHIDASPADPTLVRYCHDMFEATGQRIWSVRTARSEPRPIRRQAPGEMITHEFWWPDPSLIGYTYQDRRGDPTLHDLPWAELAPSAVATRLGIADLEGREVYLSEPLNCYHTHLYVSRDGGARWTKVWDAKAEKPSKVKAKVELRDHVRGMRDFWVRAECRTGGKPDEAGLNSLAIRAVFQHNMFARPHLVPGRNRVTVSVANPEVLPRVAFDVTYAWREGRATRSHAERIPGSPTTFTIRVGGKALPRMLRLEMKVGAGP